MRTTDNKRMPQPREEESVVQIDELALDKECIRLPSDYLKYAHRAAECKCDMDELKAELDVVEADLTRMVRKNPAKYGMGKVTETGIKSAVILQKSYQKAEDDLRDARYNYDLAQAVVWALECKKRSLTLLVELHGMGYFANPKISRAGKEAVEQMTQRKVRTWKDD
jgi:hypothetical protein